jgi:hypothetical protein
MVCVFFMGLALFAKRLGAGVKAAERAHDIRFAHTERVAEPCGKRCGVRRFLRSVAAVAATVISRANRAATGMRDRSKAWRPVRYYHANGPAQLAFDAHAVRPNVRSAIAQERADDFDQLMLVYRAAPQLEIDKHMINDRRGFA